MNLRQASRFKTISLFSVLALAFCLTSPSSFAASKGFEQISAGNSNHTCALLSGSVYCWGDNSHGELGNGSTIASSVPVLVSNGAMGNSGVSKVVTGYAHTCALKNGSVYCWGYNTYGTLGDGTTTDRTSPVALTTSTDFPSDSGVTDIAAGEEFGCVLKNSSAYCWGRNAWGQLGDGTSTDRTAPVAVSGSGAMSTNTDISQLAAGALSVCALKNGSVYCWGINYDGELGDGQAELSSNLSVAVTTTGGMTNSGISQISNLGLTHTCAIQSGAVFCWGQNTLGQIGDGTTTNALSPTPISTSGAITSNSGITQVAAGTLHTCAIQNGTLYCWGYNSDGQLGNGTTTDSSAPVLVSAGAMTNSSVAQVTLGNSHTCALKSGLVYCWGFNGSGQLGDFTTTSRTTPVLVTNTGVVSGNNTISQVNGGSAHACALKNGSVYCWGNNGTGQLGTGNTTNSSTAVLVTAGAMGNSDVSQIAVGYSSVCALKNGSAYCWGSNGSGQLGDGTTTNRTSPVAIDGTAMGGNSGISQIAIANTHTCAIKNGALYCWGFNNVGQVGDNTLTTRSTPTPINTTGGITSNTGISQVMLGASHSCALKNGAVFCWGYNFAGQLGDNTTTNRKVPTAIDVTGAITSNSGITQLGVAGIHTCVLKNGGIYCWGQNLNGQIGDGTTTQQHKPVAISTAGGITSNSEVSQLITSSGSLNTCALKAGSIYCWGANNNYQVGDGTTTQRLVPTLTSGGTMTNSDVTQASFGGQGTGWAIKNGVLYGWGYNVFSNLGDGTSTNRPTPVMLSNGAF